MERSIGAGSVWVENLVIGAFNLLKMLMVGLINKTPQALFLAAFFLIHYGIFCSVHGRILADLINVNVASNFEILGFDSDGPQELLIDGLAVLVTFINELSPIIWLGLAGIVLSHLVSFIENFILKGQLFKTDANKLMAAPYSQIIVMHVGLILGAFLLQHFDSPVWMLALIVLLKMIIDFKQFKIGA